MDEYRNVGLFLVMKPELGVFFPTLTVYDTLLNQSQLA